MDSSLAPFLHGPLCTQSYRDTAAQAVAEQHRHKTVLARLDELEDDLAEYRRIVSEYRVELQSGPRARL